jgi:hypothetical protein
MAAALGEEIQIGQDGTLIQVAVWREGSNCGGVYTCERVVEHGSTLFFSFRKLT